MGKIQSMHDMAGALFWRPSSSSGPKINVLRQAKWLKKEDGAEGAHWH